MPVESNVAVGTTIAEYLVEELVGSGGMGEVYRARDERLGPARRAEAPPRRLADDSGFRERLLRESRLAASLDHPNVVPVYEAGEADGRLFIAMRYVDGTDLKALLRRRGRARAGSRDRDRRAGRRRPRRRARARAGPPRREAVERAPRPAGRARARLPRRLRADAERLRPRARRRQPDGHGRLRRPRADPGRGGRRPRRRLRARLPALRDAHGLPSRSPACRRSRSSTPTSTRSRRPRASAGRGCRRGRRRPRARDGEGARGPPADRDGARGGGVGGARARPRGEGAAAGRSRCWCLAARRDRRWRWAPWCSPRSGGGPAAVKGGTIVSHRPRRRPGRDDVQGLRPPELGDHEPQPRLGGVAAGRVALAGSIPATGEVERFTTAGEPRDLAASGDELYVASDGQTPFEGIVARYNAITGPARTGSTALVLRRGRRGVLWVAGCPFLVPVTEGRSR